MGHWHGAIVNASSSLQFGIRQYQGSLRRRLWGMNLMKADYCHTLDPDDTLKQVTRLKRLQGDELLCNEGFQMIAGGSMIAHWPAMNSGGLILPQAQTDQGTWLLRWFLVYVDVKCNRGG